MKKTFLLALAAGGLISLAGCRTQTNLVSPLDNPGVAGGWVTSETARYQAVVQAVDPNRQRITLLIADRPFDCKAGPGAQVGGLKPGDIVKATILEGRAFYLPQKSPPPKAGAGVKLQLPDSAGDSPLLVQTVDVGATVLKVDVTYRHLTLQYETGIIKTFKVDFSFSLDDVKAGDKLLLREFERVVTQIRPN